jgi:hypothetical protein
MALSGDEIILNRQHTTRLNVAAELTNAFDRYKDGTLVLQRNIEDLKAGPLSLGDAQRKLFEIFYRRLLSARMLIPVTDSYLSTEDRTDWDCSTPAPCTPRIYLPTAICGHMHNWASISGLERPTTMPAKEKMPRRQFRRIITTLCHRWHIPAYSDYVSESYWPAFSRLDDAGQHAFSGVCSEQGRWTCHHTLPSLYEAVLFRKWPAIPRTC